MSCQFQSTHYKINADKVLLKNTDNTYSHSDCTEPIITNDGLMNTEENKRVVNYRRDQLRYLESKGQNGYRTEYEECGENLGTSQANPTKCTLVEALTHPSGDGFEDYSATPAQKQFYGNPARYNEYGSENAAFARVHLKEGNEEEGYLKIQNPPNLFRRGGRNFNHYLRGSGAYKYHKRLDGNVYDEKACAYGISQFCPEKGTAFYATNNTALPKIAEQALDIGATPGQANVDAGTTGLNRYNELRGYR